MPARAVTSPILTSTQAHDQAIARRAAARRRAAERRRPRLSRLLCWLLSAVLGSAGLAYAQVPAGTLPTGGRVVVGSGQVQSSANLMTINQSSQRLGMDWQSFNIGSAATVQFVQPSASSIALNRVLGNSASEIYGQLKSNGQIFLTNPNGVLFARGSKVDVGGLVASTLDLSQEDFAAGRYVFRAGGAANGAVVNQGSLRANAGGYLALFGNRVDNQGDVAVDSGSVVLASGRAATVSISGNGLISAVVTPGEAGSVVNSGRILADGGTVTLTAHSAQEIAQSLVNNSGIVRVHTLVERNGEIWITGDQVSSTGSISADATGAGNAGRVVVKGGMQGGSLDAGGTISAQAEAGRGGEVETSAAHVRIAPDMRVNTLSGAGAHGTWTIDPIDFTVAAGGAPQTASGMGADTLSANLNAGNVTLANAVGAAGSDPGDIHVNAAVAWNAGTTLTVTATRNININANITVGGVSSVGAGLVLTPGTGGVYTLATGSKITFPGTQQNLLQIAGVNYTLIRTLADLQGINTSDTTRSGNYALADTLDATTSVLANNGLGFVPIGNNTTFSVNNSFRGRFDGLGHAIDGLVINRPATDFIGLFGVTHDATIRNLQLTNGSVTGLSSVGALVGYAGSQVPATSPTTFTNVQSSVPVTAAGTSTVYAGGLVGRLAATSSLVDRSSSSGTVTASSTVGNLGGLVGNVTAGSLSNSSASGAVTATGTASSSLYTGGLVGSFDGVGTLGNSSASGAVAGGAYSGGLVAFYGSTGALGTVSASGPVSGATYVGGLIGQWSSAGSITNGQTTGSVTSLSYAGGLVGYGTTSGSISNSSASGNVTSPGHAGGLVGYLTQTSISGSSASGQVSTSANTADNNTVYAGGLVGQFSNSLVGGQISNSTASGSVSSAAPRGYVGGLVGYLNGGSVTGVANITTASGQVQATNTTVNDRSVGGLIGYFDGTGTLSNVKAIGNVSGGQNTGGLVGYYGSSGNLSFGTATGTVTGNPIKNSGQYVGGLIGQMSSGGAISDSQASGNVFTNWDGGGLIGYWISSGNVTDSQASGNVLSSATSASVGGLIGYGNGGGGVHRSINNAGATGSVTGGQYAGGLVGLLYYTSIDRGTAVGKVTTSGDSTAYGGGLVGYYFNSFAGSQIANSSATGAVFVDSANAYVGGLVGEFNSGSITASTASGNVTGRDSLNSNNSEYSGGLVGVFNGAAISDSAATGNVVGSLYSGGLAGFYSGTAPLSNSSATGSVSGTQYVGGLVGYHTNAGITNGFASGQVTSTSTGGYTGGLAGYAYTYAANNLSGINDSRATGNVSGGTYVGGLIGRFDDYTSAANSLGGVSNSSASGNVSGTTAVGGLVGYQYSPYGTNTLNVSNSRASGDVQGTGAVGGLVGDFSGYAGIRDSHASGNVVGLSGSGAKQLGGLVGQFNSFSDTTGNGVLARSYATGSVRLDNTATLSTSTSVWAGGLVGYLSGSSATTIALTDSYATGAVTLTNSVGRLRAGGLVGSAQRSLTRSYATGAVSATGGNSRVAGGLAGERATAAVVSSSFWATDTTGQASSFGGTATTLAGLKSDATFPADWDLATTPGTTQVWRIYDGLSTPLLRSFLTPLTLSLANVTKVYDGTTSLGSGAITVGGTAVANPERILVSGVSANAGSYTLGAANVYSVHNGYDLTVTGSASLAIGQRPLTLAGLAANKVYDGTAAASVATNPQFGGLVSGEDLVFQPGTGFAMQFATKTAGTGKTVNITGSYTLTDGSVGRAANYVVPTATSTTADITPATLSAGSFSATNRAYDGTTSVTVSAAASTLTGVMPGDNVAVDLSSVTSGTVATKNAGTAKPVTISGIALSGADVGNYVLAGASTTTVDIAPKVLTVNGINATDRAYNRALGVTLTTTAVSLSGLESGDQVQPRLTSLSGNLADKNVANGKAVTVSGLALRGPDAANYTPQAGAVNVNITPRAVNMLVTTTGQTNRLYDGTTTASVALYNDWTFNTSNLWAGDDVTVATTSTGYADKNVAYNTAGAVTSKTITVSGFSLSGTDAFNFALQNTSATTTGTISPKPLTVSGVSAANRIYDGTRDVAVTIAGATVDTTAVVLGDTVSVATPGSGTVTGQIADKNVGTAKPVTVPGLALTGIDAGNYSITSGSGGGVTVNITRKDVTATYTAANKVYDFSTGAVVISSTTDFVSTDNVLFASNQPGCQTFSGCGYGFFTEAGRQANGTFVQRRHVGTALPVVVQSNSLYSTDAANYNLLNPTGATTADITPKPVNLAYTGVTKVYDGTTDATVSLNISASGVYSQDTVTSTQTAAYTGTTAKDVAYNSSGGVTSKPIGVTNISLAGLHAGNYAVGNTSATTTGILTAKPITVSGIAATDRAYDGTTTVAVTAGTVTSAGFLPADTVAVALPVGGLSSGTIANKNVGLNKPVAVTGLTLTGADAGNYSIDSTGSGITVNISQLGLTPTYSGVSRVYNGGISATVTSTTVGIASGDTLTFNQQAIYTGANARDAGIGKPIGVSNITLGGSSAANYTLASTSATTTGDITPKPVTATYTGASRVYNGVADVTAAVVGNSLQFVAGDTVGLSETASFTGDGSSGINKAVSISNIAITGAQAGNYSLLATTANTTATITPRPLGVTGITATNRVYDGTQTVAVNVAGASVNTTTVVAGDVVSVTLPGSGISTGTLADRHVGNNRPVAITGLNIAGSSAANYTLVGASGLTVNITPKSLTAVYGGVNKVYDGNADAVVTGNSGDIFAVDAASLGFSAQGLFTTGKNVGTGKAVNVISAFLTGTSADNYALTNPTGTTTADITPRALTANYGGGTRVYDGTVNAPVSVSFANRVAGDNVGASQTAEFTGTGARNVGNGKAINVSNIALTGSDSGNYRLDNTTDATTGSITPKGITVSGLTNVLATDRVYDASRDVVVTVPGGVTLVPNSSDIVAGDTVTIDVPTSGVTTGTVANKNVGNAKAVTVTGLTLSGTDAANYNIAGTAGITVNITPKSLTAAYSGVNKVYDGSASVNVTGSSADLITGDSLLIRGNGTVTGSGAKDVGTAKPVTVSSADLSGTDAANYTLVNTTGTATADITRRAVTPSYLGGTRVYDGGTSAPVTNTVGNFVTGDNISLTETAVFAGASSSARNAGVGKAIQVSGITLGGTDAGNYSLTAVSATATGTITPKLITLTGLTGLAATDRVYDGTRGVEVIVSSTGTIDVNPADIVFGDVVSVVAPTTGSTTGTMLTKDAGASKALVVNGLNLTGTHAGNYSVSATNGVTVNIAQKSLTAVYTGVDKVYDGTAAATVVGSSADKVAGDSLSITGSGVFSAGKSAGTGKAINVTAGSLGSTDAANYLLVNNSATASADITPKAATVSYVGGTRIYDGTVGAPVSGTLGGLITGDTVALSQTAVFSGGASAKNVGTGKAVDVSGIALGGSDGGNYSLGSTTASTTASVIPRPLGIIGLTGVSATDRVYDGTTTVAVTVATTGTVSPNPSDLIAGDVVTITAPPTGQTTGTMATKNVGTNKPVAVAGLALGGADAANYSVASTSGVLVNISPKTLTASYTAANRVYDGTTVATATGSSADIVAGDSVLISASGVFTGTGARNIGTAKPVDVQSAALSSADAGNYTLANPTGSATANITPRPVSTTYAGGTRVYDGSTTAPVSGTATGFVAGDVVSVAETANFSGTGAKNIGSGKAVLVSGITLSGVDAANYELVSTTASTTGGITLRPLNVTGLSGITAVDRVYDGTVAVQVNVSGTLGSASGDLIAGDDVTVNVPGSGLGGGTMLDKNAGQNKAVALNGLTLSGADSGNYAIAGTAGLTVNIAPKTLTASYTGTNKVYDGTAAATIAGNSSGIVSGDAVLISATGVFTGTGARNVGTAKPIDVQAAALSGADASNYALVAATGSTTADITPRPVTTTYVGGSRVYDGTTAAPVTRNATGVITGDTVVITEAAVFTGTGARNVGTGKAVDVSGIALAGADAGNYALVSNSASTTGTVTQRPLNVSGLSGITAADRVYDGTTAVQVNVPSNLGTASGDVIPGDLVTVNVPGSGLGGGTMVDKNVGQSKAVALNGLTLSGADAPNYAITGTAGVTVNIAARAITLQGVSTVDRVYDATTSVALNTTGGSISGGLAGDDLQLRTTGATGSMADKHAGLGKAVNVSGLALGGADASNYTVAGGGGLTVNIAQRTLTPSFTAADKVYDGIVGATTTLRDDRIAGDALTLAAASTAFADKNAGTGKAVTASGLALTGADAGDYRLSTTSLGTTATITPAPATVTANSLAKVYGETATLSGGAFSALGLVPGENIGEVTLASAGTPGTASVAGGPYAIDVSNARGGNFSETNYTLTYRGGQLDVTPRPLTVATNSVVRFADEPNPTSYGFSTNEGGLVGGDTIASVVQTDPPGSAAAPGGSVYLLTPSNGVFGVGTPSNYGLRYGSGLLLVLPKPPLPSDPGGSGGDVNFAIQIDAAEVKRAEIELDRTLQAINAPAARSAETGAPAAQPSAADAAAEIAILLAGDSRAITLPVLQKLPLFSLDPQLRRLILGGDAPNTPPAR